MMRLVARRCPTCGTEGRKIACYREPNPSLYGIPDVYVPLRACSSCGLNFFDLLEGVNVNGEIYSRIHLSSTLPKKRHHALAMIIDRMKPDSSGLELGAGACHVGALLSETMHRVTAMDRYDDHPVVKSHVSYVNADCSSLDQDMFEEEAFDWVLADNVLEHLPDYRTSLEHCVRWLKKDGIVIICVPNARTAAQYISKRHRERVYRPVEHVNNFSEAPLNFLLSELGCRRVRVSFPVRSLFEASMWVSINLVSPFGIYKIYRKSDST